MTAAGVVALVVAIALAIPGVIVTELASARWVDGVGEAMLDVGLYVPLIVFTFVAYRETRAL